MGSTVVATEVVKMLLSALLVLHGQRYSIPGTVSRLVVLLATSLPMMVPAVVYVIQNTLNMVALQNLSSGTHALLVQLKLLTTAVFAVVILRKDIFVYQWRALLLLFVGVVLVQYPSSSSSSSSSAASSGHAGDLLASSSSSDASARGTVSGIIRFAVSNVGLLAAVCQACLSGFAGVYTEWKLKGRQGEFSLWDANLQLSLYSVVFGLASMLGQPGELAMLRSHGFFHGFSWLAWCIVLLNSFGGLLVAGLLLYMDNITKNFAATVSLISTSLLSYALYRDIQFTAPFVCGAAVVLSAIAIYNEDILQLAEHIKAVRARSAATAAAASVRTVAGGLSRLHNLTRTREMEKLKRSEKHGELPKSLETRN